MLRHYVEFKYPTIFGSARHIREIAERDAALIAIPDHSFGFRFFSQEEVVIGGETITGEEQDYSPWIYQGEECTLDLLKKRYGNVAFIAKMEQDGCRRVVMTRFSQTCPLQEGDRVRS